MKTKIFTYGVLAELTFGKRPPTTPQPIETIEQQLQAGQDYYNQLIATENERREAIAAKRRELYPDYEATEQAKQATAEAVDKIYQDIRDYKRTNRTTKIPTDLTAKLKHAKGEQTKANKAEQAARKAIWNDPKTVIQVASKKGPNKGKERPTPDWLYKIDQHTEAKRRELRAATTVFWGTYQAIEAAFKDACSDKPGGPLNTKQRRGEGFVAHHFQTPMTWKLATSKEDKRLRIWPNETQKSKHQTRHWAEVWIASEGHGKPIHALIPFLLHRPLPENALIKWVKLHRYKVATRWRYELQFTVSYEPEELPTPEGTVGVDVGWRFLPNGDIRAAYWIGSDNDEGEVIIPAARVSQYLHARSLQEIRDRRFNAMKAELLAFVKNYPDFPQAHQERFKTLDKWKSTQALKHAFHWWKANRIANDEAILAQLQEYARKEDHLYEWQANEAMAFEDWRKNYYRNVAAQLSKRYGHANIEDIDLSDMQRLAEPGKDNLGDYIKRYKNVVSPSILLRCFKEKFAGFTEVEAEYTTMKCHVCGSINDTGAKLVHDCFDCGETWDIDRNAALNILHNTASGKAAKAEAALVT